MSKCFVFWSPTSNTVPAWPNTVPNIENKKKVCLSFEEKSIFLSFYELQNPFLASFPHQILCRLSVRKSDETENFWFRIDVGFIRKIAVYISFGQSSMVLVYQQNCAENLGNNNTDLLMFNMSQFSRKNIEIIEFFTFVIFK